jgi:hypothetical protein
MSGGAPPGYYNLTSGCHGISKPANFSSPVCSPTGEAGKNVQNGFFGCSVSCHRLFTEIGHHHNIEIISKRNFMENP